MNTNTRTTALSPNNLRTLAEVFARKGELTAAYATLATLVAAEEEIPFCVGGTCEPTHLAAARPAACPVILANALDALAPLKKWSYATVPDWARNYAVAERSRRVAVRVQFAECLGDFWNRFVQSLVEKVTAEVAAKHGGESSRILVIGEATVPDQGNPADWGAGSYGRACEYAHQVAARRAEILGCV